MWLCPATIISDRHVLAPASIGYHMTSDSNTTVRVGSLRHSQGTDHIVDHVLLHPLFEWDRLRNNIAIVRVNKIFEFTPNVRVAYLPTVDLDESGGQSVMAVGWGWESNKTVSRIM